MERRIITVKDFQSVARNNEYFLWHFMQKKQKDSSLALFSYFDKREGEENKIKEIMDLVNIPYFESYTEDSIDFLNGLGIPYANLWSPNNTAPNSFHQTFNPIIIGFKKFNKIKTTQDLCYCVDGVLEIILELNPEILSTVNTED
jgi:hypothetical protein